MVIMFRGLFPGLVHLPVSHLLASRLGDFPRYSLVEWSCQGLALLSTLVVQKKFTLFNFWNGILLIIMYLIFFLSSLCTIPVITPNGFVVLMLVTWVVNTFWGFKVQLFT